MIDAACAEGHISQLIVYSVYSVYYTRNLLFLSFTIQLNSVSDEILFIVLEVYSQVTKFHLIISVWIYTFAQWLRFLLHLLDVLHPFGQCRPQGFREDKREEGSQEGRAAHQQHRQLFLYLGEL